MRFSTSLNSPVRGRKRLNSGLGVVQVLYRSSRSNCDFYNCSTTVPLVVPGHRSWYWLCLVELVELIQPLYWSTIVL